MKHWHFPFAFFPCIAAAQLDLDPLVSEFGLMGVSVTAFCGDSIQASAHSGFAQWSEQLPVTSSTKYRIASVSKAAVALACARMVESDFWAYEDDVNALVDWNFVHPSFPELPITIGDLLSHQSGLRDGSTYADFLTSTYSAGPSASSISNLLMPSGNAYSSSMWGANAPGAAFHYANINYGMLATVMEAATGVRFDLLMDSLVFEPLGITGSFNIGFLPDLDEVATLYRNLGGWTPQADDFVGNPPTAWDYGNYLPGTNGLVFSPQGGLRISTDELARLGAVWANGSWQGIELLEEDGLLALSQSAWDYNGVNGNNYYGLFNSWSLGLHRANLNAGDDFFGDGTLFIGHPGEAYGLISDAYVDPVSGWGFAFATNGAWNGYAFGVSSWYEVEESLHQSLAPLRALCIASNGMDEVDLEQGPTWGFIGQKGELLPQTFEGCLWLDARGQIVSQGPRTPNASGAFTVFWPQTHEVIKALIR